MQNGDADGDVRGTGIGSCDKSHTMNSQYTKTTGSLLCSRRHDSRLFNFTLVTDDYAVADDDGRDDDDAGILRLA